MAAVYRIATNLPPEAVSAVALEIYRLWVGFALGWTELGGHRLVHPTGRYAAAIRLEKRGMNEIAILVNDTSPPEAGIIEEGHGEIDLKVKLQRNRPYRMHRTPAWMGGSPIGGLRREGGPLRGVHSSVWSMARGAEATGFAQIGQDPEPGSWVIPPMAAYRPAALLADIARDLAEKAKQA